VLAVRVLDIHQHVPKNDAVSPRKPLDATRKPLAGSTAATGPAVGQQYTEDASASNSNRAAPEHQWQQLK